MKWSFILVTIYLIRHIILKATHPETNYAELFGAIQSFFIHILWILLKWKWPISSTNLVFLYAINECVFTNLYFRELVPDFLHVKDKLHVDDKIIATIIGCYCFNYNSFISTSLVFPPLFLISYYCQLLKQVETW